MKKEHAKIGHKYWIRSDNNVMYLCMCTIHLLECFFVIWNYDTFHEHLGRYHASVNI